MKKIVFLLLVVIPFMVFGQKSQIKFEASSHSFGTISETGGKAVHDFLFKNTGDAPLIITNVRAGCGCTTPEWSREPIAPGATGNIKVSFDPTGRPGAFIKSVTVNTNGNPSVVTLTIRGNVSRKPASPYASYKFSIGTLKLTTLHLNLNAIKNDKQTEKTIDIINSGTEPLNITATSTSPAITVNVEPKTLGKGEKGKIQVIYDAQKKNDWGFVSDKIEIKTQNAVGNIMIVGNIQEDFSAYNGDFSDAPVAVFSEMESILENLAPNSTVTHEFYIQNTGKSDLIIRKTRTSDNQVSVNVAKTSIKPGKKTKVVITFKTGQISKATKIIQFTLNDPRNSIATYKIVSILKK